MLITRSLQEAQNKRSTENYRKTRARDSNNTQYWSLTPQVTASSSNGPNYSESVDGLKNEHTPRSRGNLQEIFSLPRLNNISQADGIIFCIFSLSSRITDRVCDWWKRALTDRLLLFEHASRRKEKVMNLSIIFFSMHCFFEHILSGS